MCVKTCTKYGEAALMVKAVQSASRRSYLSHIAYDAHRHSGVIGDSHCGVADCKVGHLQSKHAARSPVGPGRASIIMNIM